MKTCPKCGSVKANSEFSKNRSKKDGLQHYCKPCHMEATLRSQKDYNRIRNNVYKRKYGLTLEQYDQILEFQDGRCAICHCLPRTQYLAVDHNHLTKEIRGLLCQMCNHRLLGGAREKIEVLEQAIQYLREPPARKVLDKNDSSS